MIEDDPFAPLQKKAQTLDLMSIEELEEKIEALTAEIEMCRKAIAAKRAQRSAADSLFSPRGSA
ncbi:MAG: DUF1192 domain-containing protein [Hyphomonadaceae bacterium]